MENENWNCSAFSMEIQHSELNHSSEHQHHQQQQQRISNCFFNPNWENQLDQNDPFESALSSMVSSPVTSHGNGGGGHGIGMGNGGGDNVVLRELIGRLGSICNSGEISPHSYNIATTKSTENSCYSTPLNSPPKLNLSSMMMIDNHSTNQNQNRGNFAAPFSADPEFVERAARFSTFGSNKNSSTTSSQNYGNQNAQLGQIAMPEFQSNGKLSRVSSFQSRTSNFVDTKDGISDSREQSSVSDQISVPNDGNGKKRKAIPKGKNKEILPSPATNKNSTKALVEKSESNPKRSKSDESSEKEKKEAIAPEPLKDYIHVRARRGQATDSHSLAERVRREKISERMKFLQDLVPGCNKVTGKAVMLDEIINYVQSLQRQVEFLSMKLSTVNPRSEYSSDELLTKDGFQSRSTLAPTIFPLDASSSSFPYQFQTQGGLSNGAETAFSMNAALRRNQVMHQLPQVDGFGEASSQVLAFWENDLHSVVQMGFGPNQP